MAELGARGAGLGALLAASLPRVDGVALGRLGDAAEALLVRHERLLHVEEVLHLALRQADDLARVVQRQVARILDRDVAERDRLLRARGSGRGEGTKRCEGRSGGG